MAKKIGSVVIFTRGTDRVMFVGVEEGYEMRVSGIKLTMGTRDGLDRMARLRADGWREHY